MSLICFCLLIYRRFKFVVLVSVFCFRQKRILRRFKRTFLADHVIILFCKQNRLEARKTTLGTILCRVLYLQVFQIHKTDLKTTSSIKAAFVWSGL